MLRLALAASTVPAAPPLGFGVDPGPALPLGDGIHAHASASVDNSPGVRKKVSGQKKGVRNLSFSDRRHRSQREPRWAPPTDHRPTEHASPQSL